MRGPPVCGLTDPILQSVDLFFGQLQAEPGAACLAGVNLSIPEENVLVVGMKTHLIVPPCAEMVDGQHSNRAAIVAGLIHRVVTFDRACT